VLFVGGAVPHQTTQKMTTDVRPHVGHRGLIDTAGAGTLATSWGRSRRGDRVCIVHLGKKTGARVEDGGAWPLGRKKRAGKRKPPGFAPAGSLVAGFPAQSGPPVA
jgi:hypothetical protein